LHDIDKALAIWNTIQLRTAASFEAASETFERALIFNMPDLAELNEESFAAWHAAVFANVPPPRRAERETDPVSTGISEQAENTD
jgi:hypothetical protein